jgi:hypothetical protein
MRETGGIDIDANEIDSFEMCCNQPYLTIYSNQFEQCVSECEGYKVPADDEKFELYRCCVVVCNGAKLEILKFSTDPNVMPQVEYEGFINSYMISVDHNPEWEPIIRTTIKRCFDDSHGLETGYECNFIPNSINYINQCSFKELFLKCPRSQWNQNNTAQLCAATREFIEDCFFPFSLDESYY